MSGSMPSSGRAVPVITIDGPSGVGKGTLSRKLAQHLGWHFLDSGALYRILALAAQRRGVADQDEAGLARLADALAIRFEEGSDASAEIFVDGERVTSAIRADEVGAFASRIAVLPQVRAALLERQRRFRQPPGLVADGRDMGTVVFPDATLKIFLTASVEERARRRQKQLREHGVSVNLHEISRDIEARDNRDRTRAVAPLKPAADAKVLDTSGQSVEKSFDELRSLVEAAIFASF